VNGSTVTVTEDVAPEGDASSDAAQTFWIGNIAGGERTFDGTLDEIRISNVVRSDGWRETSYNNQHAPGDFLAWGDEVPFVRFPMHHYMQLAEA
jgi:hypothetical protein